VRYVLLAAGFFVLAVAGIVIGTVADAHRMSGLSSLAVIVVGLALGLVIAMSVRAYILGVRLPSLARQLTAMVEAMNSGQPVSGQFWAGLRDLEPRSAGKEAGSRTGSDEMFPLPGQPPRLARWVSGRVVITPKSVVWVRRISGRTRDLTGAQCTNERRTDPYTEMTLTMPDSYKGEILRVLALGVSGTDVEVITQVQQLEILRYSLERTPWLHDGGIGRVAGAS
jgi:hypothetical protein